ncbi:hypothetical protein GCM10010531_19510 [Blastococcus jejuensis]|uniref:Transposase n=1 Tax=Blastococcus jejuensis TaxID=351224 RepID=A0ABP6P6D7_9ACTN
MGAGAPPRLIVGYRKGWALAVEPQAWEAPVNGQRTSVGLDVHARSMVGRGLDVQTGEVLPARLSPAHEDVIGWLRSLPGPVKATHEAGPTGFGLTRALEAAGIECVVAAPSRLLRHPPWDRPATAMRSAAAREEHEQTRDDPGDEPTGMSAPRATVTGSARATQRNEGPSHLPPLGTSPAQNGLLRRLMYRHGLSDPGGILSPAG